jgi:kynurenine formamidase
MLKNYMPCYNGVKKVEIAVDKSMEDGNHTNSLTVYMGNHVGTHIDFPLHYIRGGKTFDAYSPEYFIFDRITVVDIPLANGVYIDEDVFKCQTCANDTDLLLIRTGYGQYYDTDKYWNNNPGLSFLGAKYIKNAFPHLRAIGIDFISVNAYRNKDEGRKAHTELLTTPEVLIIEDMDFSKLTEIPMRIIVAPLPLFGADGAPCNIIAEVDM